MVDPFVPEHVADLVYRLTPFMIISLKDSSGATRRERLSRRSLWLVAPHAMILIISISTSRKPSAPRGCR